MPISLLKDTLIPRDKRWLLICLLPHNGNSHWISAMTESNSWLAISECIERPYSDILWWMVRSDTPIICGTLNCDSISKLNCSLGVLKQVSTYSSCTMNSPALATQKMTQAHQKQCPFHPDNNGARQTILSVCQQPKLRTSWAFYKHYSCLYALDRIQYDLIPPPHHTVSQSIQ